MGKVKSGSGNMDIWEEKAYSGFMMTQNGFVQFYAFITSFRNSNILDNQ